MNGGSDLVLGANLGKIDKKLVYEWSFPGRVQKSEPFLNILTFIAYFTNVAYSRGARGALIEFIALRGLIRCFTLVSALIGKWN